MKRTSTKRTKPELHCIARCQLHTNMDTVKYGIQSGEKRYIVTLYKGRATACEHNGETCPSYKYNNGTCKHAKHALALECERGAQLAESEIIASSELPEMVAHDDVESHVDDSLRSGELSWVEQQRQARAEMSAEEKGEQLLALGERRWMAA